MRLLSIFSFILIQLLFVSCISEELVQEEEPEEDTLVYDDECIPPFKKDCESELKESNLIYLSDSSGIIMLEGFDFDTSNCACTWMWEEQVNNIFPQDTLVKDFSIVLVRTEVNPLNVFDSIEDNLIALYSKGSGDEYRRSRYFKKAKEEFKRIIEESPDPQNYYYDISKTEVIDNISDTTFMFFSNDSIEDRFSITVPIGNINETSSVLLVEDHSGNILLRLEFKTLDLVGSYGLYDVHSDQEVIEMIKKRIKFNLDSRQISNDYEDVYGFVDDSTDFIDYNAFKQMKESGGKYYMFYLNNEYTTYYGFLETERIVVALTDCC